MPDASLETQHAVGIIMTTAAGRGFCSEHMHRLPLRIVTWQDGVSKLLSNLRVAECFHFPTWRVQGGAVRVMPVDTLYGSSVPSQPAPGMHGNGHAAARRQIHVKLPNGVANIVVYLPAASQTRVHHEDSGNTCSVSDLPMQLLPLHLSYMA